MLCGRQKEVEEALARCRAGQLLVVSSQPGLGITTFLNEGLAPGLRARGLIVVTFRDWMGRLVSVTLKQAIAHAVREQANDTFTAQTETLDQMLERVRASTGCSVALLLDQFEDYFRCHRGTDLAEGFDAELAIAIAEGDSCFVIAVHEFALAGIQRFQQYVPDLRLVEFSPGPLDKAGAMEAVMRTGNVRGFTFEAGEAEALVAAPLAAYQGGVHPFFLMAGVERMIDLGRDPRAAMDANRLILESLDPKLDKLSRTEKELLIRWLPLLLTDQRLAVSAEGLNEHSGNLIGIAPELINRLLESGILRAVEVRETSRYEITRDSYAPMVRDWWKRWDEKLTARRRMLFGIKALFLAIGSVGLIYVVYLLMAAIR